MPSASSRSIVASTGDLPPALSDEAELPELLTGMSASVREVEELLNYRFKDKKLVEDALTHSSYTAAASYQRLEFLGDNVLALAVSSYVFLAYPDAEPGELSLLRSANVSTEKLARVAVRHGLYKYIRHNTGALDQQVWDFVETVQEEDEEEVYGGVVKAPKVLADIVESVAAAVYVDCGMNLEKLWVIFRGLLEPIVTLDLLQQQPQPVTSLFELCQKDGKQVNIKHWRNRDKTIATVCIDGTLVASAWSKHKENAKLNAAKIALQRLSKKTSMQINMNILGTHARSDEMEVGEHCGEKKLRVENAGSVSSKTGMDTSGKLSGSDGLECAKQKLHELCVKKRWPRPTYRIEKQTGPAHERRFVCSVRIEIVEVILLMRGEEKSRVKDAESSAASAMLQDLQYSEYI